MKDQDRNSAARQIVVGIGASAGGLEAFQSFLKGLPADHGLIVVLVQHLDPDHDSLMPELVSAKTASPVHSVEDGMKVEPGHIYLIPPGFQMRIEDGRLWLTAFESPRGLRRPIDHFFRSLAKECGENAVAVVLSGTGSDGSEGARDIKAEGGLVFVQDPKQAKYDGMPQSVLNLGGADVISRAEEVISVIQDYFNLRNTADLGVDSEHEFLARIMRHVRFRTGHDFSEYKAATMMRRIAVRMSVLNISDPGEYLKYVAENKAEVDLLFRDLLINVTGFFRDPNHFATLKSQVIPEIIEGCEEHGEIRIWCAGCSTGEEAYSVGMQFAEEVSRTHKQCKIIVFGTDIDDMALSKARLGHYPDSIADAIPEELLERYFRARNDGYEVGPKLREMVRFSRHSFVKDPPFSKLDLVICRNVLIYFKEPLQETAIRVFHYALKDPGFLFVGPSENPGPLHDYFTEISSKSRIFRRRPGVARPLNLGALSGAAHMSVSVRDEERPQVHDLNEMSRHILNRHGPAHIHVDRSGKVVFTSESAARYLRVRAGAMSQDVSALILPELEAVVRRAVRVGEKSGQTNEVDFQGEINGIEERLVMVAERMADGSLLIVIHDRLMLSGTRIQSTDNSQQEAYTRQLESELDEARQAVRTTVEELETSNEELKSSNEEMMSMNEELQSANEELTTINDELQEKLRALNQANTDLKNFTDSARIATVFLDDELRLVNFTPQAEAYFSFTRPDIGRSLSDLTAVIDDDRLRLLCSKVLRDQDEIEEIFESEDGKIKLLARIMIYTPDTRGSIGVVFTLQDVTELQDAIERAEELQSLAQSQTDELEQLYRTSPYAMGLFDKDFRYLRLNEQLAAINGEPLERHYGACIRDIIPGVADSAEAAITQVIETGEALRGQRIEGTIRSAPDNHRIWECDWVPYYLNGDLSAVALTVRDITDQVETSESLRRIMRELEHRVKNMLGNVIALINQAKREVEGDAYVYEKLTQRINALAKTHALLTASQWSSAPIVDVIEPETASVYGAERVTLAGPNLYLNAQATLALGMVIHELATNAAKYGAFSTEEGRVAVNWARLNDGKGDRFCLTWKEAGGPAVSEPETNGFGSQLIKVAIEGKLGGKVSTAWEEDGLRFDIELAFHDVSDGAESNPVQPRFTP